MRRRWRWILLTLALLGVLGWVYVATHSLEFMDAHCHCIKAAGLALGRYADEHQGQFPFHPKGYGNALLLIHEDYFYSLTGPGYDTSTLHEAKKAGKDLPEEECGRVYIQGLTEKCDPNIALLFDKLPTPGGDHCHLPIRLWASLGREVLLRDGSFRFVLVEDWPEFTKAQVDLLVKEGLNRQEMERLFSSKPK